MSARPLRIVVIAPLRFPLRRPHSGGLESAVWSEVDALRDRGHDVTFIAPEGSDFLPDACVFRLPPVVWRGDEEPTDKTWPASYRREIVPALGRALDEIAAHPERYDVISNHCLDPLPLRRAPHLGVAMVTTLHTPVDGAAVSAHAAAGGVGSDFLSVSTHTKMQWDAAGVPSELLPNGVDPKAWTLGPGGDDLVWFGRIVPEKAPHVAVEVAHRLGRRLVIAGRIGDESYARDVLFPSFGDGVEYAGELAPGPLAALVGRSGLALATPAWAEPFGLVGPEALMCGTPVVGFAVGGVPEIAAATMGMQLVAPGDVAAMTARAASMLPSGKDAEFRAVVRETAERRFSLDLRIDALEASFARLLATESAA